MRALKVISIFSILALKYGCTAQIFDVATMNSAEKDFNASAAQKTLTLMSLETMFPDADARELANAAAKGKVRKVEGLVKSGISVDVEGTQGATPLFWAMANYNGFEKLLQLGADPNIVYGDGNTVIHMAVRLNDSRFVEAILDHEGDPNLRAGGSFQQTPLFEALSQGKERIELLLSSGADINARNSFGSTPAMTAVGRGDFETAYYLLDKGSDYQIKNKAGETLVDRIADKLGAMRPGSNGEKWQLKIVNWLERRGVKVQ